MQELKFEISVQYRSDEPLGPATRTAIHNQVCDLLVLLGHEVRINFFTIAKKPTYAGYHITLLDKKKGKPNG